MQSELKFQNIQAMLLSPVINKIVFFIRQHVLSITILLVNAFFLYNINRFLIDFPFLDDYYAILLSAIRWEKHHNILELFKQHNEHRIFFVRLVSIIQFELFGSVNFRWLILFGSSAILILSFLLVFLAKKHFQVKQDIALVPIPFILCSYLYCEATYWAMCGIQHLWTLVFLLVIVLLLKRGAYYFWLALFISFITIFSSGNALFLIVVGFLTLLSNEKHKYKEYLTWVLCNLFFIWLYSIDYHSTTGLSQKLSVIKTDLGGFLSFNFAFQSAFLLRGETYNDVMFCVFMSISILFVLFISIIFNKKSNNLILAFAIISFVLFSSLSASLSRNHPMGLAYISMASRYKIYSIFAYLVLYLFFLSNYTRLQYNKMLIAALIVFSFFYSFYTRWLCISMLYERKITIESKLSDWANGKNTYLGYGWDDTLGFDKRKILIEADS